VRCVHFMRTSAVGIITGEPRIGWVTEDSKCLNKNHVLYEKQFPLLVHTCKHVFRFYNNTTLLERNYILCSELQRVAECWRNGQQMGCTKEFHAIYRIRRPGLPLSPGQSMICGGRNRTGTYYSLRAYFSGAFAKLRTEIISFVMCVCVCVCPSAWKNSASTGRFVPPN
jgi:hypothetical protein